MLLIEGLCFSGGELFLARPNVVEAIVEYDLTDFLKCPKNDIKYGNIVYMTQSLAHLKTKWIFTDMWLYDCQCQLKWFAQLRCRDLSGLQFVTKPYRAV